MSFFLYRKKKPPSPPLSFSLTMTITHGVLFLSTAASSACSHLYIGSEGVNVSVKVYVDSEMTVATPGTTVE